MGIALTWLEVPAWATPEMIPEDVWAAANQVSAQASTDLVLAMRDGSSFRLSDHHQKPVLLAFWASWCGPCQRELPALSVWAKSHPEVEILAVDVDRHSADAERFLANHQDVTLPVAFAPDAAALGRFGVTAMPTMFLVGPKGEVQWQHEGYNEDKGFAELEQALAR